MDNAASVVHWGDRKNQIIESDVLVLPFFDTQNTYVFRNILKHRSKIKPPGKLRMTKQLIGLGPVQTN